MDWPLSRDEKKRHLMHLYDKDAQISDFMLSSGEVALANLKAELECVRRAPGCRSACAKEASEDAQRLWHAVETAAAVLKAVVPNPEADHSDDEETSDSKVLRRTRSQGAVRGALPPLKPALSRTPRGSCEGLRLRVSFGEEVLKGCRGSDADSESTRSHTLGEPEPEEPLHTGSPGHGEGRAPFWRDRGLMEFCVPVGEHKVGLHLKDLPPKPLIVRRINEGSWTEAQGIRVGDVVIAVGGHRAESLSAEHFVRLMQTRPLRLIIEQLPKVEATATSDCH